METGGGMALMMNAAASCSSFFFRSSCPPPAPPPPSVPCSLLKITAVHVNNNIPPCHHQRRGMRRSTAAPSLVASRGALLHVHAAMSVPQDLPAAVEDSSPPPLPEEEEEDDEAEEVAVDLIENQSTDQGAGITTKVKFVLEKACNFGEGFYVVGSHGVLGGWDVEAAITMDWSEGHVWSTQVDVPVREVVEFKYIRKGGNAEGVEWQAGPNRRFETVEGVPFLVVSEPWEANLEQEVEIADENNDDDDGGDDDVEDDDVQEGIVVHVDGSTIDDSIDGLEQAVAGIEEEGARISEHSAYSTPSCSALLGGSASSLPLLGEAIASVEAAYSARGCSALLGSVLAPEAARGIDESTKAASNGQAIGGSEEVEMV